MSDTSPFGFGRFVPGFDFLQNLAKGSAAGMPAMSHWVAPTVSVEELDKRIEELKAVQFWLDQNSRALAATVQALEVQKMTLATLKGMNVAMEDLAGAFTGKTSASEPPAPAAAPPKHTAAAAPEPHVNDAPEGDAEASAASAPPGVVDPMQWWSALGTQFQQIAANAMKDVSQNPAFDATRDMAAEALKTATGMASHLAAQAQAPAAGKRGSAPASRARTSKDGGKPAARASTATPRTKKPAAPRAAAKKAAAPRSGATRRTRPAGG